MIKNPCGHSNFNHKTKNTQVYKPFTAIHFDRLYHVV